MFLNILSATTNYADYALLGVAGLLLLGCFFRGFGRSLYGFFFSLVIILTSFYVSGVATDTLVKTEAGTKFNTVISDWSESWGPGFNNDIYFVGGMAVIYPAGNPEDAIALNDAIGSNKFVGFVVGMVVPKVIPEEGGMSLADVIVPNITYIGSYLIVFILALILLKILFKIIGSLWDKITHDGQRLKFLDKTMGGVLSLLYTAAFAFFILAILGLFADKPFLSSTIETVQASQYCSWFFDNNPVLNVFTKLFIV